MASIQKGHHEVEDFKKKLKLEAETLVTEKFPAKVLQLEDLLADPLPKKRKEDNSGTEVRNDTTPSHPASVPLNKKIFDLIQVLKPYIHSLIEDANSVKMWILFLIPRIEDGNNFGVSIQEDTLAEVRQVETEAATYLDQVSAYFVTRGKIISKLSKYPFIEDYKRAIVETDEKQLITIKLICKEIRNNYANLHDTILKNMEKIKKPRTSNHNSLY